MRPKWNANIIFVEAAEGIFSIIYEKCCTDKLQVAGEVAGVTFQFFVP